MSENEAGAKQSSAVGWAIVLAIVLGVGAALWASLGDVEYRAGADEGYYLRYMSEVSSKGFGTLPALFEDYNARKQHQIFPPPSRVGFIAVSVLFAKVFGASLPTLSKLSLASHLALIVLVFVLARRWLGDFRACLIAALVAFSPLYLGLARRALTDSFITLVQFATVGTFIEYLRDPTLRRRALVFVLAFTFAILTKEISVLLAVAFVALAALERWHRGRPVPIGRTAAILIVPGFVTLGVWTLAAGSLAVLVEQMRIVFLSPASNGFAILFGSGGWYRYPVDEFLMSPWPTALGLGGLAVTLWRWRRGEYDSVAIAMVVVYVCQIAILSFFTKNLRYVAVLDVPLRILAVALLWDAFTFQRRRAGRIACSVVVALLCVAGWSDYQQVWVRPNLYDPVFTGLIRARQMVPLQRNLPRGEAQDE